MRWCVLIPALHAILAFGAEVKPSRLYVVSAAFSDHGTSYYYRLLEVQPDGRDTIVRYARVAPVTFVCPYVAVQSIQKRLPGKSPAELIRNNNPCAVEPESLRAAIRRYPRAEGAFESISFGLVAECGGSDLVLGLPISQTIDLKRLRRSYPKVARLWELAWEITESVFGRNDVFQNQTETADLALQQAGRRVAPELISGVYDAGLAAALGGSGANFRSILRHYRGPLNQEEVRAAYTPRQVNPQTYQFSHFVNPEYPPLARQARIQGNVELQVGVDRTTGEVQSAGVISGHPC